MSTDAGVSEIIAFADKHFERRGWSSEFLAERLTLAEHFPDSEYYYTQTDGKITGSLAVTYAEFSPELLMQFQIPGLPMEISLQIRPLSRPVGRNGESLLTELRTYAINREFHKSVKSSLFFAALSSVVRKYKNNYSELMDKPVIFTYGDEVSLKLYGSMGFENLTEKWNEQPVNHAGSQWWIMGITPNQLQKLLEKEYNLFSKRSANGHNTVLLPDGREIQVTVEVGQNDLRFISEKTEVAENIWAAEGSDIIFSKTNHLLEVSRLAFNYHDPHSGVTAAEGSQLRFFPNGKVHTIEKAAMDFEIQPNVWVRTGDRVEFTENGDYLKLGKFFYNPNANHPRGFNGPFRPRIAPPEELNRTSFPLFRSPGLRRSDAPTIHEVVPLK